MTADPSSKILSLDEALEWRESLRKAGRKLVLTNGCFDILHRGHAEYLLAARRRGDALIVLLNSDASVKSLKGPGRPVCKEQDRAFMLSCLSFVDAALIFAGRRCVEELAKLKPDVYVKGGDYNIDNIDKDEKRALLDTGAEIHFIPLVKGLSTSSLLEKASS